MPGGRPTKFRPEFCDAIQKLEGAATDSQIAEILGVTLTTLWNWKESHPEFMVAVKRLKSKADDQVESALYQNARNMNPTAQIFWLKNRKRSEWKDRNTIEGDSDSPLQVVVKSVLDGDK